MKSNQLYPFERNRYYAGKMLTSSDFQAEQSYFNHKRRFINSFFYGSGIICGCNVCSLDELSILLESGAAMDDFGREIVVESSVVKKLSSLEGFSEMKEAEALLCIRYQETPIHSVFAVNNQKQGDTFEYNRISEGYELFLMDAVGQRGYQLENDFFLNRNLYEDRDIRVELVMPAAVCRNAAARINVKLTKLSEDRAPISWSGELQIPSFVEEYGKHELHISFQELLLEQGQWAEKDFWIWAETDEAKEANLVFRDEAGNQAFSVRIEDTEPDRLVMEQIAKTSLELLGLEEKKDYVPLAKLKLLRTDSAYIIDEIKERGIKNYISAPGWEEKRREYNTYFLKHTFGAQPFENKGDEGLHILTHEEAKHNSIAASGTVEIPLGADARKGDICYSGEIMHGLGRGDVYVALGYESYEKKVKSEADIPAVIYGNADLFDKTAGTRTVDTAVKVMKDRGSFIVAVKLLKKVNALVLTYRWTAILCEEPEHEGETRYQEADGSITIASPTVILGPKESYYFHVDFHQMEKCSLIYELTEEESGEISPDGIYTAPNREGVYEIHICCAKQPSICTYAYAIVREKKE